MLVLVSYLMRTGNVAKVAARAILYKYEVYFGKFGQVLGTKSGASV